MSAETIQAQYEQLDQLAKRFQSQAEANQQLLQTVRQRADALREGWQGSGSEAFHREMDSVTYPAMNRLTHALTEGSRVTMQIARLMKDAEEDAAAPFRQNGAVGLPLTLNSTPQVAGGTATLNRSTKHPTKLASPNKNIWDYVRVEGDIWKFDKKSGKGGADLGVEATIGIKEKSVWGKTTGDGVAGVGGYAKAGVDLSLKDGVMIGAGGEIYAVKGEWDTALMGNKRYGVTGGVEFKAFSADGFAGVQFDGDGKRIGAKVGLNLASAGASLGGNIAGYNVSVVGQIGLKAELGFGLDSKGVQLDLPIFSIGFKWGGGVD